MIETSASDLVEERDFLLKALTDLEAERESGAIDEGDYSVLRDGYTARAAAAIRALEGAKYPEPAVGQPAVGQPAVGQPAAGVLAQKARGRRHRRRAVVALAVVGLIGLGVAAASTYSSSRLPGETTSGSATLTPAQHVVQDLAQGRILAAKSQDLNAIKEFSKVLAIDPHQPEALAYRGWLVRLAGVAGHAPGLLAEGRASVQAAIVADPTYPDAHAFMGYILFQDAHDPAGAVAQFRLFLADRPPVAMVTLTKNVVAQAFATTGQAVPAPTDAQG
ncbi:MAG: tetratricopeptide repeat protein [Acidimicrobiales bacterium]